MAPLCCVAQVVKVLPSFESNILKFTNTAVPPHARFQIFRNPMDFILCKSTCHQLLTPAVPMKVIQLSINPSLPLNELYSVDKLVADDVGHAAGTHDLAKFCKFCRMHV